jgi:hypothetical protein
MLSPTSGKKIKCLGELKRDWVLMSESKKTTSELRDVCGVQHGSVNQGRPGK